MCYFQTNVPAAVAVLVFLESIKRCQQFHMGGDFILLKNTLHSTHEVATLRHYKSTAMVLPPIVTWSDTIVREFVATSAPMPSRCEPCTWKVAVICCVFEPLIIVWDVEDEISFPTVTGPPPKATTSALFCCKRVWACCKRGSNWRPAWRATRPTDDVIVLPNMRNGQGVWRNACLACCWTWRRCSRRCLVSGGGGRKGWESWVQKLLLLDFSFLSLLYRFVFFSFDVGWVSFMGGNTTNVDTQDGSVATISQNKIVRDNIMMLSMLNYFRLSLWEEEERKRCRRIDELSIFVWLLSIVFSKAKLLFALSLFCGTEWCTRRAALWRHYQWLFEVMVILLILRATAFWSLGCSQNRSLSIGPFLSISRRCL